MTLPKPDWQTIGDTQYDIAMPSGRIWHALAAMKVVERLPDIDINWNFRLACESPRGLFAVTPTAFMA